jgi:hypothetical protein
MHMRRTIIKCCNLKVKRATQHSSHKVKRATQQYLPPCTYVIPPHSSQGPIIAIFALIADHPLNYAHNHFELSVPQIVDEESFCLRRT